MFEDSCSVSPAPADGRRRHVPSQEQCAIVDAIQCRRKVKSPAFAGAAKSTTARFVMQKVAPAKVLYIAYNTSMAADMRASVRAFTNTTVSTGHALAMKDVGHAFRDRLESRSYAIRAAIEVQFTADLMRLSSSPDKAADAVLGTLLEFQSSADPAITEQHVPEHLPFVGSRSAFARLAALVWADMTSPEGRMPVTHDTYFKYWQSTVRPRLDAQYDVIIFDEAQDANPVMLAVLADQQCAKLVIGDTHQSLYGFRHAVNALESLGPEYEVLPLTQSFRFGPAIAALSNAILVLKNEPRTLRGTPTIATNVVTQADEGAVPDLVLARSNAGVFEAAYDFVVRFRTVDIIGGVDELIGMVLGAYELNVHGRSTHPAFRYFKRWVDLVEASKGARGAEYAPWVRIVERNGPLIPDMCALIRNGVGAVGTVRLSTVHKAKGLEAPHVRLAADFAPFCEFNLERKKVVFSPEEANVYYVAITRAQRILELGPAFEASLEMSLRLAYQLFGFPPAPSIAQLLAIAHEVH